MDYAQEFSNAIDEEAKKEADRERSMKLSKEASKILEEIKLKILSANIASFTEAVLGQIHSAYMRDGLMLLSVDYTDSHIFPNRERLSQVISAEFEDTISRDHKLALDRHRNYHLNPHVRRTPFGFIPDVIFSRIVEYANTHQLVDSAVRLVKEEHYRNDDGVAIRAGYHFMIKPIDSDR